MNKGVVDIGNTRVKAAIFNTHAEMIELRFFDESKPAFDWLSQSGVLSVMAASVDQAISSSDSELQVYSLTHTSKIPFANLYTSPETLGVDRIAAMAAASVLYPSKAVLVFDIGTCMTIDLLQPDNSYKGGNISPGIQMRLNALHQMTGRLPLVSRDKATIEFGDSTQTAIASGVVSGMQHEIEGYIQEYSDKFPDLVCVLCGGDYSNFVFPPKYKIFADQNFVLKGLYYLLLLNEK